MIDDNKGFLNRIPLLMLIFVLIAALYAGWVFYSRWNATVEARRSAAVQERERARKDIELNGGSQLKITSLYSSASTIRKGQTVQLCYGVVNAKHAAFDPPVDNVWPSTSRCVDVSPEKSTTYTFHADDGAGHSDKAQISLLVK